MQFIGVATDGRAPGDKWIRTHLGWKRLREIGNSLRVHVGGNAASTALAVSSTSSSKDVHHSSEKREQQLRELYLMLSQRCVSTRRSSRESNHYATISDAVNKLNFTQALNDATCYPFVCQVVMFLFKHDYLTLSGSMQRTLLRIAELAKEIAIVRRQYTGLVVKMVDTALKTLEKGRRQHLTGFSIRTTDSRIKALLKSKRQLQDALHDEGFHHSREHTGWSLCELPSDCLRHIISFLRDPSDIANVGQTCSKLYWLTEENNVWKEMTVYHYGKDKVTVEEVAEVVDSDGLSWRGIFIDEYRRTRGNLRGESSGAVCLCQSCLFVYWKAYGHPCSALTSKASLTTNSDNLLLRHTADQGSAVSPSQHLTVQQFLGLFTC